MSDREYGDRAARQQRILVLAGVLLLVAACAAFAIRNSFYDLCTASFQRDPQAVAQAYLEAIRNSDPVRAQDCWDHNAFFNLSAGCSEICLSRIMGVQLTVQSIEISDVGDSSDRRSHMKAQVTANCPSGEPVSGAIILDSVRSALPWKHYRVIQSDVGGNSNQPWCQQ